MTAQSDLDEMIESILRVVARNDLQTIANVLSGAYINAAASASADINGGTTKLTDVLYAALFISETVAVHAREAGAQIEKMQGTKS